MDGYYETFNNLTGATEASDYLTYGLVDTVQGNVEITAPLEHILKNIF